MNRRWTLVAFYGAKDQGLAHFLQQVQEQVLHSPLGNYFEPYLLPQIHATLMGLETEVVQHKIVQSNYWEATGLIRPVQLKGIDHCIEQHIEGLKIRFGGFNPEFDTFLSWKQRPYLRSFGIHIKTGKVVVNGWPVRWHQNAYHLQDSVWQVRRDLFEHHHLRHKYHQYRDNDVFLVLGDLQSSPETDKKMVAQVEADIRNALAQNQPHYQTLSTDDLHLVSYQDPSLHPVSSHAHSYLDLVDQNSSVFRALTSF